jgi:integrase
MALIRYTDQTYIAGGKVNKFPVIMTRDSTVHLLSLNYFLDLYATHSPLSTIKTYAGHVCDLLSQLEAEDGMGLDQIHDAWIRVYKESIVGRNNTENYASQVLRTCISFLKWLEDQGIFKNLIGEKSSCQVRIKILDSGAVIHPAITKEHRGRRKGGTPRIEWINAIKPYGPKRPDLSNRFELMIDWGKDLGLRAKEICALKIEQLPSLDSSLKALREERLLDIKLTVTKGSKSAVIPVHPLLIKKTWDFIYTDRVIVTEIFNKRLSKDAVVYSDPGFIFLSEKTGSNIGPVSFSNSIRKAFLFAVKTGELTLDERVWLHGLRHNFTTSVMKKLDSKGVLRPEAITRQITRHGSDEALEPYLTDRFNRDFHG